MFCIFEKVSIVVLLWSGTSWDLNIDGACWLTFDQANSYIMLDQYHIESNVQFKGPHYSSNNETFNWATNLSSSISSESFSRFAVRCLSNIVITIFRAAVAGDVTITAIPNALRGSAEYSWCRADRKRCCQNSHNGEEERAHYLHEAIGDLAEWFSIQSEVVHTREDSLLLCSENLSNHSRS